MFPRVPYVPKVPKVPYVIKKRKPSKGKNMDWHLDWTVELVCVIRLFLAGVLGAVIGLEREYRAKEAGVRTHFLVAIGSALIMLVSQWGFNTFIEIMTGLYGNVDLRLDPSRVAAQVVSGIGFIGAGTIMMQKQFVRGLTTAAGLWAVAGIGLAVGGGMYIAGIAGTILVLIGLELLGVLTRRFRTHSTKIVFLTKNNETLIHVTNELNSNDFKIVRFSVDPQADGHLKVNMHIREHSYGDDERPLLEFLNKFKDLQLEKIE